MNEADVNNMVGRKFGRLTVLRQMPSKNKRSFWECICECGNVVVKKGKYLRNGDTQSCGCMATENTARMGKANAKKNSYEIQKGKVFVRLNNSEDHFICDESDIPLLSDASWFKSDGGYARASINGKFVFFHNLVLGHSPDLNHVCDHIDGNRLNNQKNNLRVVNRTQNAVNRGLHKNNTSGVTGVSWNKNTSKWTAYISVDKTFITLGEYDKKEDAIISRLNAEEKYFKEYSRRHSG